MKTVCFMFQMFFSNYTCKTKKVVLLKFKQKEDICNEHINETNQGF